MQAVAPSLFEDSQSQGLLSWLSAEMTAYSSGPAYAADASLAGVSSGDSATDIIWANILAVSSLAMKMKQKW